MRFQPDYHNLLDAACNRVPACLPLYEHIVDCSVMEALRGVRFASLYDTDKPAFFREFCLSFREFGYDTVSFEGCMTGILPGGGALGGHKRASSGHGRILSAIRGRRSSLSISTPSPAITRRCAARCRRA